VVVQQMWRSCRFDTQIRQRWTFEVLCHGNLSVRASALRDQEAAWQTATKHGSLLLAAHFSISTRELCWIHSPW
jgi:hypothetical protein